MTSKTGIERGFTLVEVMIAACVLAMGAVLVYNAFFTALDTFNYCQDYLDVAYFADEKIWQGKSSLSRSGGLGDMPAYGDLTQKNRQYHWDLSYSLLDETKDQYKLFKIDFSLTGTAGRRKTKISRSALALFRQE